MDAYTFAGKWLQDLNAELTGSDRACAVLAGALLDDRLKLLLQKYLLPPLNDKEDKLLGRSGAVESFSARIELARRLALVGEEMRQSLDWVRDIRNDAAHSADFSFDQNSIRDRVSNVVQVMALAERIPSLLQHPYDNPKGRFVAAMTMLVGALEIEIGETTRTAHVAADIIKRSTVWRTGG